MSLFFALLLATVVQEPAPPEALTPASALAATPTSAPILSGVPLIIWKAPDEVGDGWRGAREAKTVAEKMRAVRDQGLASSVCTGLVDLQALARARESGLAWKDRVRGRGWARPTLARVLTEAHAAWLAKNPSRGIAVGDVAQAGCGLVDPGVLTRVVRGADASAWLAAAEPIAGRPVVRELMRGDELPDDADGGERFAADLPVLVDAEADAWAADAAGPTLLVRVRRYEAAPLPTPADLKALERDVGQILQRGERVGETVGPDGVREHWVEGGRGRQLVLVRKAPAGPVSARAPFRLADASDIRMGPWANDRPGAFRSEERWLATAVDGAAPTWERWRLVLEGAHATHQTGRDADLSYPLADARKRFVEAVDQIDIKATWRWFVLLHATGETLGVDVERIIVGPRVLARLLAEVPEARGSRLIKDKVIRVVGGHDDHHHIRIATPTAEADAAALEALTRPASAEAAPPATAPALP